MDAADERKRKQLYLIENVAEDGFDTSKFNAYLAEKRGPSFDINSISFEELVTMVSEFKQMSSQVEMTLPAREEEEDSFTMQNRSYAPRDTMGEFDVVDDFDQFKVTQLKDLPKPVEREFVKTKSVRDLPSEVSYKAIETKI